MTTNALTSSFVAAPCDCIYGFRSALSDRFGLKVAKFSSRRCWGGRTLLFPRRTLRVSCQTDEKLIRRYSPFLGGTLLSTVGRLGSDDWQAVPDIWRSSAETYGDRIALVDPYHNPPSSITYNQLEQEILNFSEGLRVTGVKPDEKLALYADNSSRWLIADQVLPTLGPILVMDEPFTIDSGLMTPTMKIRRDRVVALYKDQISELYN